MSKDSSVGLVSHMRMHSGICKRRKVCVCVSEKIMYKILNNRKCLKWHLIGFIYATSRFHWNSCPPPPWLFSQRNIGRSIGKVCPTVGTSRCFFLLSSLTQRNATLVQPTARTEATLNECVSLTREEQQPKGLFPASRFWHVINSGPANSPDVSLRVSFLPKRWLATWCQSLAWKILRHFLYWLYFQCIIKSTYKLLCHTIQMIVKFMGENTLPYMTEKTCSYLFLLGFNYKSHGYFLLILSFIIKSSQ